MASIIDERSGPVAAAHDGTLPPAAAIAAAGTAQWGNSAPLALAAFAVTTFLLSMVNANFVNQGVEPVVFGVALMFGGITQLVAGVIQFRNGNTFTGVLFSTFGAFWMSLFAIVEYFLTQPLHAAIAGAVGSH